ncbi:MAG: hypothetical protein AAF441_10455 [Pseudomonadota bacterium]
MRASGVAILLAIGLSMGAAQHALANDDAQQDLAAAFIVEAEKRCGHEMSETGMALAARRSSASDNHLQIRLVRPLWRRIWACDPDFISGSCLAARWNLCKRVYEDYGPQGVVIPGLLKPIIKK